MLKRIAVTSLALAVLAGYGFASSPFDQFNSQLTGQAQAVAQSRLDNFSKDLGALMGGGSYHQAESLGILGFDAGIQVPMVKVPDNDAIMKAAGQDTLGLPILQVEKGLPGGFDILARFTSYSNATLYGVGVRYGLYKSEVPGIPSVSLQAVYNKLDVSSDQNKLSATALTGDAIVSISLPIITPYIGVGIIQTGVNPDSTITSVTSNVQ